MTSYIVEVRVELSGNATNQAGLRGFKTWARGAEDRKTLLYHRGHTEPGGGFSQRNGVLTVLAEEERTYFIAAAQDDYGGELLRIGPRPEADLEEFMDKVSQPLAMQYGRVYLHFLEATMLAGRPIAWIELRADGETVRYAIDTDAMFVLAYEREPKAGGRLSFVATSVEYNPVISSRDVTLDTSGRRRIDPPSTLFAPAP